MYVNKEYNLYKSHTILTIYPNSNTSIFDYFKFKYLNLYYKKYIEDSTKTKFTYEFYKHNKNLIEILYKCSYISLDLLKIVIFYPETLLSDINQIKLFGFFKDILISNQIDIVIVTHSLILVNELRVFTKENTQKDKYWVKLTHIDNNKPNIILIDRREILSEYPNIFNIYSNQLFKLI